MGGRNGSSMNGKCMLLLARRTFVDRPFTYTGINLAVPLYVTEDSKGKVNVIITYVAFSGYIKLLLNNFPSRNTKMLLLNHVYSKIKGLVINYVEYCDTVDQ